MLKRLIVLLMSIAMMLPFAGCGSGNTSSSVKSGDYGVVNDGKPVTLLLELGGFIPSANTEPTAEAPTVFRSMQYLADEFTKMYPNVTIEWDNTKGSFGNWSQWMTTQVAAGTAPAVTFLHGATYADKGWFVPLDNILEQPNIFIDGNTKWKDIFPSYLWNSYMTADANENIVAIPYSLYPGSATAYYYNKDIFKKVGVSVPKNWEEFITACKKINDAGYIAVGPAPINKTVNVNNWDIQFSLGPVYAAAIKDKWDYNGDGIMSQKELLRAEYEGVFYAKNNPAVLKMYGQVKRKYTEVLQKGAGNTDYESLWTQGKVAMMEDGLWRLPNENANTQRKFDFGLFPAPVADSATFSEAADIEMSKGPYQPPISHSFNIVKPTVESKGEGYQDATVKFLQWITKPENMSQCILEQHGTSIGAVKGTAIPPELNEWFQCEFPKLPQAQWATTTTIEGTNLTSRYLELWVSGYIDDNKFIEQYDKALKKGIEDQISGLGVDTTGWKKAD